MLDPPLFLSYRETGSLDPYISCIASVEDVVVGGNTFGELRLYKSGTSRLLHTHYGTITALQVTICRNSGLLNHLYLVCGTSFGCIYIHLVKVNDVISSRVVYKFRVESPIIGITLHPKYAMSNLKENFERRTYDIRNYMKSVDETNWKQIERYNNSTNSFIFATGKGIIYLLKQFRYRDHDDIVVTILSHFNTLCKSISLSWHHDLVAWCDYHGVQIFSVKDQIPIAFLPYETPVYPRDLNINKLTINRPRALSQYMTSDDLYVSSDDSSSVSSQEHLEHGNVDIKINKDMLNETVKTHFINDKYVEIDYTNFPFMTASICWLNKNSLLVGYNNIVQCISFASLRFRNYGKQRNMLLEGNFDLLDITHSQCFMSGNLSHSQSFNISVFMKPRNFPLKAYLAYTIEMPQNNTVLFLSSHGSDSRFSIISSLNRVNSCENVGIEQRRFRKREGRFIINISSSPNKESLKFETFDNCTYYKKMNETFVQCLCSDSKNKIEMKHLSHVICDINNDECKIIWKQQLSIYSVLCLDYRNFKHCLKPFDYIPIQRLSSRLVEYCNRVVNPYIIFRINNSGIYLSPFSLLCYNSTQGSDGFGSIYIANMGKMILVEPCDLKGYMNQLIEHEMFSKAMQHIVYYRKMLYATEFDGYLLNIFTVGIQTLLSKSYLNIKTISCFTLLCIKCCNELVSPDYKEFLFQKIIDYFCIFGKMNILIGYILSPDLESYFPSLSAYKSMIQTFIDGFRGNEFLTILRMVSFWRLDEHEVEKIFYILKRGLTDHLRTLECKDWEISNCLIDNEMLTENFSSDVSSKNGKEERGEILKEILESCNELSVKNFRSSCYSGIVKNTSSDFELLNSYLSRGSESLLQILKKSSLSPNTIAGILAFGVLLYNCGYYEQSFIFFLHSKSPLVFNIAKMTYDMSQNPKTIFRNAYLLYSIDSNEANRIFELESSKSSQCIETVVEMLKGNEEFLLSYLQMLYSGGMLPLELYPLYIKNLATKNADEIISFIKSAENVLKDNMDLISGCTTSLKNATHEMTLYLHNGNTDSCNVMRNLSELYAAKAYLLSLLGSPPEKTMEILMFSVILGYETYNKYGSVSFLEKFSLTLKKTFGGRRSNEMLHKCIRFFDNEHYSKYSLIRTAVFCNEIALIKSQLFRSNLKHLKNSFMNIKDRGMVFYSDFKPTNSTKLNAVKRYSRCFLCRSIDARFFDCDKFSKIIHILVKGIENVDIMKNPGGNKILHFFCGHVSHECCQIKIINYAILLKNTVEKYHCDYRIKNVESVCLLCLSNV